MSNYMCQLHRTDYTTLFANLLSILRTLWIDLCMDRRTYVQLHHRPSLSPCTIDLQVLAESYTWFVVVVVIQAVVPVRALSRAANSTFKYRASPHLNAPYTTTYSKHT